RAWPARWLTTTWPLPSPNTMAAWSAFFRASSPSLASMASTQKLVIQAAVGKKEKWREPSVTHGRVFALREVTDIHDVNRQARQWLAEVAHQRVHRETRQRPIDRFQPNALRPLPIIPYDYRDTVEALVHKDLRLQFDSNRYCVPHRYVGRRLILKADSSSVTI